MRSAYTLRPGNGGSRRPPAAGGPGAGDGSTWVQPNRMRELEGTGLHTQVVAASGIGYEIADGGRTRRNFGVISGLVASADRHQTKRTLGQLREFCRMHDRQSTLFSGILDRAVTNIFGANFDFVPRTGDPELDKTVKEYITRRMEKRYCDAAGELSFVEMAQTGLRALWNDGDFLWVKRNNGTMTPFEADQIETPRDTQKLDGKRVVLGVELSPTNKPRAFYVKQRLTKNDYGGGDYATEESARIPAGAIVCRPAYRKRYHQTRGVPFLAVILATFDRTNNYLDYESLAAEGDSMRGYKITRGPDAAPPPGEEDNPDTGSSYDKVQKMEPFMIFDLGVDEDVGSFVDGRPGANFESYLITCCRIIGVGVGYPLELLLLDFSRTNYSSARASILESRRSFRGWQKSCQRDICLPWHRWQIDRGIAAGELPADPRLYRVRCQWPAWEGIDLVKEGQGNQIGISFAGKSVSETIRDRGREPIEVFDELEWDIKELKKRGIILDISSLLINTALHTGAAETEEVPKK